MTQPHPLPTAKLKYTIRSKQNNWELKGISVQAKLTPAQPFFVAEGEFDNLHEILKKEAIDITYDLTLSNGKVFSGKRELIEARPAQ